MWGTVPSQNKNIWNKNKTLGIWGIPLKIHAPLNKLLKEGRRLKYELESPLQGGMIGRGQPRRRDFLAKCVPFSLMLFLF